VTRIDRLEPAFVETIPRDLEPGKLYVSIPYTTVVHLCPCGCGSEVVTSLHPARFSLTYDGDTISLDPSVGSSGLACRSHYFIRNSRVRWCDALSDEEVAGARARDRRDLEAEGGPVLDGEDTPARRTTRGGWSAFVDRLLGRRR
jgi:hypothetical protein